MAIKVDLRELKAEKHLVEAVYTHPSCHAPTICETDRGVLLLAFYAGKREGAPDSVVLGSRFDKVQKKWSRPQVWVHVAGRAVANPRLFQGPDGAVWLLLGVNYGPRWCSGYTYLFLKRSYDDGKNWTDLELFVEQKGLLGKNKPFVIQPLWIIPLEWEREWSATFLRSEDDGRSWQLVGDLGRMANAHLIQPTVVQLSNGRLMAYMRSQEGFIYVSYSEDLGKTWSLPVPTGLPNNNSGLDLLRTESGLLLLAYNPTGLMENPSPVENGWPEQLAEGFARWGPRTPLCLAVSKNDGQSWDLEIIVEDGPGEYSYPSLIQSRDGAIHLVYTYRRRAIAHVTFPEQRILGF